MGADRVATDDGGMNTSTHRPESATTPKPPEGTTVLVVGALVLLTALVAGLVLSVRDTTRYPDGSPEAVAQSYVQALFDDDPAEARRYLAPELAAECHAHEPSSWWIRSGDSVRFSEARGEDDRAEIRMTMASVEGVDPLDLPIDGASTSTREAQLVLVRRDGTWVIVDSDVGLHGCNRR